LSSQSAPSSRRRLRILALVDGVGVSGGGERFARQLTLHLDPERFERIYCATRWRADEAEDPAAAAAIDELRASGVEFIRLQRRSRLGLRAWMPLLRLLRERPADVLHSHKFGSNVWGALIDVVTRPPVFIAHEQTWSFEGQPGRRFLDRELIARRADAFVAVSSEDRRRMIEVEHIRPSKVLLMPNAVPSPEPGPRSDVRSELGIGPGTPVIGAIAVLRPQKALEVLLEAVARLTTRFPELRVLIAGDGPEDDRLRAVAARLGLDGTVEFLGRRTDVPAVLAALDVSVSSSDFEGTPLALMESMEAGLPVVATRVGGTPDLIDDGVEGLLVPRRDPDALANAIARLLSEPEVAREMGARGRERRRTEFDIEVAAERFGALYERLYAAAVG
jgi:glycosyltransferase involved in cell wall biosynthesis